MQRMPISNMNNQQLMQMQLQGMDLQPINMGMSGQTLLPIRANPKLPLTYKDLLLLEQLQSMRLATLCALPDFARQDGYLSCSCAHSLSYICNMC